MHLYNYDLLIITVPNAPNYFVFLKDHTTCTSLKDKT